MSPVFKGISIWKNEFLLCSVLIYHVRIIVTLGSDWQSYYRLRTSYCARQDPKAMKHGSCFQELEALLWGPGRVLYQYGLGAG